MTHDELIMKLWEKRNAGCDHLDIHFALSAVAELHKPVQGLGVWECHQCVGHWDSPAEYPCATMRAIEKELS